MIFIPLILLDGKRKEVIMNFYSKSKKIGDELWNGIKQIIDNIVTEIEYKFGPKLEPIKIKNNYAEHRKYY